MITCPRCKSEVDHLSAMPWEFSTYRACETCRGVVWDALTTLNDTLALDHAKQRETAFTEFWSNEPYPFEHKIPIYTNTVSTEAGGSS